MRRLLSDRPVDVVHAHLDNDHLIAARALRRVKEEEGIPLVRSYYGGDPDRLRYLPRLLSATDALACVSRRVTERIRERSWLSPDRVFHLEGAIDLDRFARDPVAGPSPTEAAPLRVGVVARMQTHRKFEVLLEAFQRVRERGADVSFHIIGRGTNQEKVAMEPVRRMGLENTVKFLGYLEGPDYVRALQGLGALVYLVPGSDGSCRTVREALAMGVPVIASRRGMLTELVRDGHEGLSVDLTADAISSAILRLAQDPALQRQLGQQAWTEARKFDLSQQAARVEEIYRQLLPDPGGGDGTGSL